MNGPKWESSPLGPAEAELLEHVPDATLLVVAGHIVAANTQAASIFGCAVPDLVGVTVERLLPDRYRGAHEANRQQFLNAPSRRPMGAGLDLVALRFDGTEFPVEISLSPVERGGRRYVFTAVRDVTIRREIELARRRSDERFRRVFSDAPIGMALLDSTRDCIVLAANEKLASLVGRTTAELTDQTFPSMICEGDVLAFEHASQELRSSHQESVQLDVRLQREDGPTIWSRVSITLTDDLGSTGETTDGDLVVQIEDVTARREAEARLTHLALHDNLTGVANRALLLDRLRIVQERSDRTGQLLAVLFIDLDHFKVINDTRGHATGDAVLQTVAMRIVDTVRPSDTVARLGGDEFVVVCADLGTDPARARAHLLDITDRLRHAVAAPIHAGGEPVQVGMSVGTTLVGGTEQSPGDLLRDADAAMYRAKEQRRVHLETIEVAPEEQARDR